VYGPDTPVVARSGTSNSRSRRPYSPQCCRTSTSRSVLVACSRAGYRGTAMTLGTSRSSSDRSLIRRTVSTVCQLWSSVLVTSCSSAETDRLPCRRAAEGAGRHSRRRQARCSFSCPASRRLTLAKPHHWLASTAATDVVSNACRQFVTTS